MCKVKKLSSLITSATSRMVRMDAWKRDTSKHCFKVMVILGIRSPLVKSLMGLERSS